jgi:hypothetical protein
MPPMSKQRQIEKLDRPLSLAMRYTVRHLVQQPMPDYRIARPWLSGTWAVAASCDALAFCEPAAYKVCEPLKPKCLCARW